MLQHCTSTYHVYYKPISLESAVSLSMWRKLKREKRRGERESERETRKKECRLNGPTFHVNIFSSLLCISVFFLSFLSSLFFHSNGDGVHTHRQTDQQTLVSGLERLNSVALFALLALENSEYREKYDERIQLSSLGFLSDHLSFRRSVAHSFAL